MSRLILVLSLLFATSAFGAPTSVQYVQRLNKVSNYIRGSGSLSQTEIAELKKAIANGTAETFIKTQTIKYLSSEAHVQRMSSRLEQMFGVQPTTPYIHGEMSDDFQTDFIRTDNFTYYNSLNALFRSITRGNLSWDNLLVGKSYLVYPNDLNRRVDNNFNDTSRISDEMFYNQVRSEATVTQEIIENPFAKFQLASSRTTPDSPIQYTSLKAQSYSFSETNYKVAGAITTSRFFERYPNSSANHNRKRAAAIFRIFMCDAMVPFAGASSNVRNINDFIPELVTTDNELPHGTEEDLHGTRPDCQSCHYKLDPMGKTLLPTTRTLSKMSAAGHLAYRNSDGVLVDIKGRGIGELAKGITEQSDYVSCQVNRFVHWFFGSEVQVGSARYREIVAEFNKQGRRTNDFIAYLVEQPEFIDPSYRPNPNIVLANQAKKIFQVCSNCHGTDTPSAMGYAPNLVELFFKSKGSDLKLSLEYVADEIKLEKNCVGGNMPPKEANWKLSSDECNTIKNWIKAGSPDLDGKPQMEVKP